MTLTRRESMGLLLAAKLPAGFHTSGPAFHYQAVFSPDAEAWYTRFPILVTGGILDDKQSRNLRVNGTRLIAYHWSSAYYPGDPISAPVDWLLNSRPLGGGAAAPGRTANWYDFGRRELISTLSLDLARRLTAAGYDGYFFDTLGSEQLPNSILEEFNRRHPGLDYNVAQGQFIGELRKQLSSKLIFTNQGYRHAQAFLPYSDLDLSESYFTAIEGNGTLIRKWHDTRDPWSAVKVPMEQLILPAAKAYPKVQFVHLNYAAGSAELTQRALSYSYACAKLFGQDAYLVDSNALPHERDEIYFANLGRPRAATYQEIPGLGIAWREYEKGVVAINCGSGTATVPGFGLKLTDPPRGYVFV